MNTAQRLRERIWRRTAAVSRHLALAVIVALALFGRADAEQATEDDIKAAFLFNFAKFVEWPATSFADPSAPVVVGIVGESRIGAVLDATTRGKTVNGRSLVVKRLKRTDDLRNLQIVFVSDSEQTNVRRILDAIGRQNTLTVGDCEEFDGAGGIITFVTQGHRVSFNINVDSADRAQLRISSQLLALANRVRGTRRSKGS